VKNSILDIRLFYVKTVHLIFRYFMWKTISLIFR